MDRDLTLLRGAAAATADMAVLIATIRAGVRPGAVRVRQLLVMCEEDLLSACDAIGKTVDRAEDEHSPFGDCAVPRTVLPSVPRSEATRPVSARKKREGVFEGQQELFAVTAATR